MPAISFYQVPSLCFLLVDCLLEYGNNQTMHNLFARMWKRELKSPLRACTPGLSGPTVHPVCIWSWEPRASAFTEARAVLLICSHLCLCVKTDSYSGFTCQHATCRGQETVKTKYFSACSACGRCGTWGQDSLYSLEDKNWASLDSFCLSSFIFSVNLYVLHQNFGLLFLFPKQL